MNQPGLFDAAPALVCAFGEPWLGPHPRCEQEGTRLCALFDAAVARGACDTDGYTPGDRLAQCAAREGGR